MRTARLIKRAEVGRQERQGGGQKAEASARKPQPEVVAEWVRTKKNAVRSDPRTLFAALFARPEPAH
jgi:hypothetical protein